MNAPTPSLGRVPPHDLDAEGSVLSAVLLAPETLDVVSEIVRPEQFYSDSNRQIFEAALELREAGKEIDLVSVATELRDRGHLAQVGGAAYIAQLADATPSLANVEQHAKTVREKWRVRQLIQTCHRFAAEGLGDYGDAQEFIENAERSVFEISCVPESTTVAPVKEVLRESLEIISAASKRGGGVTGTPTGFRYLDRLMSGLHDGDLYIAAGRPGMGKTSFVLNMAVNVAKPHNGESGLGVAFFSLEMPKEQLGARLLSSEARVDAQRIRSGDLRANDWHSITAAAGDISRMPIWIDDTAALTLAELRAKVRRIQAELAHGSKEHPGVHKLGLVAIDYLQLMHGSKGRSREQEISELSRGLKQLAKEARVPIMALSQLNRSVETRSSKDKRPQLSDLRESGAIEQDADCIMFIYRDEYYYREESVDKGIAEVIIAKQRNGPTDTVKLRFTSQCTRFDNLETGNDHPDPDPYDDLDSAGDRMGAGF